MANGTIPFDAVSVQKYLDGCIVYWRKKRKKAVTAKNEEDELVAMCYVDAFQSVRNSIFGELLSVEEDE